MRAHPAEYTPRLRRQSDRSRPNHIARWDQLRALAAKSAIVLRTDQEDSSPYQSAWASGLIQGVAEWNGAFRCHPHGRQVSATAARVRPWLETARAGDRRELVSGNQRAVNSLQPILDQTLAHALWYGDDPLWSVRKRWPICC